MGQILINFLIEPQKETQKGNCTGMDQRGGKEHNTG